MKKIPFLISMTFLSLLSIEASYAQANQQKLTSRIVDVENQQPLPYATIAIKNTSKGTIANEDGYFSLSVKQIGDSKLVISYIGYDSKELSVMDSIPAIIYLKKAVSTLQMITVLADNSAKSILRKAYNNIEKNYPQEPSQQTSFYRAKTSTDEEHLYVSEGVLIYVKSKYNSFYKKDLGQVKVLKGRTNYFSMTEESHNLSFYGGFFTGHSGDFVKRRSNYINPKYFDAYNFQLQDISTVEGRNVYVISFDNQQEALKGETNGTLFIDMETYAYIGLDYQRNKKGLKKFNQKYSSGYDRYKGRKGSVRYRKFQDKWHLSFSSYETLFQNTSLSDQLILKGDYIVTEIQTENVRPIPFEDRLPERAVFRHQAFNDFDDTFFDTYTTLEESNQLKQQIKPFTVAEKKMPNFSRKDSIQVKKDTTVARREESDPLKQQIEPIKVADRKEQKFSKEDSIRVKMNATVARIKNKFSFSTGLISLPISIENASYRFTSSSTALGLTSSDNFSGLNRVHGFYGSLNYDLTKRWTVGIGQVRSLNRFADYQFYDLNLRYSFLLKKMGRPLILQPQIAYWFGRTGVQLENVEEESSERLRIEDRNFEMDQINLSIGKKLSAIKSSLNLNYQLSTFGWLQVGIDYYSPLSERSRVFVSDRSNDDESFTATRSYQLQHRSFLIEKNEQPIEKDFSLRMGKLSFRVGVLVHF